MTKKKQSKPKPKKSPKVEAAPAVKNKKPEVEKTPETPKAEKVKGPSKKQMVLEMLEKGATVKQIMEATGWLRHTVFGTLANLKKKLNLNVSVTQEGKGDRVYKIIKAAAEE